MIQMTNQTIILTGVTGFLGQYILYQLFCSGYTNVFLHIRNKKNKTPLERLNYILSNKLFDNFRETILTNVTIFNEINTLQIKDAFLIHSAASVDFSSSLRDNMITNYGFTKELLDSKIYNKFIYISTAYVMPNNTDYILEPKLSNVILNHNDIYTKSINNEISFETVKSHHFTTYTLSKEMTENLIHEYSNKYKNICFSIMRPSMISVSRTGWNNSLHACIGVYLLFKSKPIHFINKNSHNDTVPVDDVAEHIIDELTSNINFNIRYITHGYNKSLTSQQIFDGMRCFYIPNYYVWLFLVYFVDLLSSYILYCFRIIPYFIHEKNVYLHNYISDYQNYEWKFPNTIKPIDIHHYKSLIHKWSDYFIKTKQKNNPLGV